MNRVSIRVWLVLSVLLSVGLAPFLARGNPDVRALQNSNRLEIAAMSESNRERLERNFKEYQQLTPEQKQRVRDFHAKVEADRADPNHQLAEVLEEYVAWLATIEPYQRDRLNQATETGERLELIRKIIDEQRERSAERAFSIGEIKFPLPLFRVPVIVNGELQRVMEEIEKLSRSTLSLAQRTELEPLSGVNRYHLLLKFLSEANLDGKRSSMFVKPPPVFETVAQNIDNFVESSDVRDYLSRDEFPPLPNRFSSVLSKSLIVEIYRQRKEHVVSPGELRTFFENLPPATQDDLLSLEAADFHAELTNRFAIEGTLHPREITNLFLPHEAMDEMRDWVYRNRPDRRRGSGFGRPNEPPPGPDDRGDRNGFNRSRDGERPPRDDDGRPPREDDRPRFGGDRFDGPPPDPRDRFDREGPDGRRPPPRPEPPPPGEERPRGDDKPPGERPREANND